jgi:hypothetical protein
MRQVAVKSPVIFFVTVCIPLPMKRKLRASVCQRPEDAFASLTLRTFHSALTGFPSTLSMHGAESTEPLPS